MSIEYIVVVQVACAFFCAFVAGRKHRSRLAWWLIGALLPVLGVVLAMAVGPGVRTAGSASSGTKQQKPRQRPKRCCGSYIPDCHGCPYFRRQLFDPNQSEDKRGYCEYFDRDLTAAKPTGGPALTVEDE